MTITAVRKDPRSRTVTLEGDTSAVAVLQVRDVQSPITGLIVGVFTVTIGWGFYEIFSATLGTRAGGGRGFRRLCRSACGELQRKARPRIDRLVEKSISPLTDFSGGIPLKNSWIRNLASEYSS